MYMYTHMYRFTLYYVTWIMLFQGSGVQVRIYLYLYNCLSLCLSLSLSPSLSLSLSLSLSISMYIYIYIYTCVYTYIYIYIYMYIHIYTHMSEVAAAIFRAKILDVGGFDSSRILIFNCMYVYMCI